MRRSFSPKREYRSRSGSPADLRSRIGRTRNDSTFDREGSYYANRRDRSPRSSHYDRRSRSPPRRDHRQDIPIGHQSRAQDNVRTIFFKGAPFSTTESDLLDMRIFEEAVCCRIVRESSGKSKGYGYLLFDTVRQAERAYHQRETCHIEGFYLFLDFCGSAARKPRNEYYLESQRKMARLAEERRGRY